jgi:hypothetical protein
MNPYSTGCTQVCNQGRDCTCTPQPCQSAAPEGGNVWIEEQNFAGPWDQIALYAVTGIALLALVIVLAGGIGWLAMRLA